MKKYLFVIVVMSLFLFLNAEQSTINEKAKDFFNQGIKFLTQNDFKIAVSFFDKATETDTTYAEAYFQDTHSVNMSLFYKKFLWFIPEGGRILDAGCGSGRDARYFMDLGYSVVAFDASAALAALATEHYHLPVDILQFSEMKFQNEFDGIWASASLLHVAEIELPDVFHRLHRALRDHGVLYASFKYGNGEQNRGSRLFTDMNEDRLQRLLELESSFIEMETWKNPDLRPGRGTEFWINTLARAR